jgi:hypothetical protein
MQRKNKVLKLMRILMVKLLCVVTAGAAEG